MIAPLPKIYMRSEAECTRLVQYQLCVWWSSVPPIWPLWPLTFTPPLTRQSACVYQNAGHAKAILCLIKIYEVMANWCKSIRVARSAIVHFCTLLSRLLSQ